MSDDSRERKETPLWSGCMNYFPDALKLVAQLSFTGNEKHNPGEPLHWAKGKSTDHEDCVARHLLEVGQWDEGNECDHVVAVAWRALALVQTMYEEGTLAYRNSDWSSEDQRHYLESMGEKMAVDFNRGVEDRIEQLSHTVTQNEQDPEPEQWERYHYGPGVVKHLKADNLADLERGLDEFDLPANHHFVISMEES